MISSRDGDLTKILDVNPLLKLIYLDYIDKNPHIKYLSSDDLIEFLLWFAAVGSDTYPNTANFDEMYVRFLKTPIDDTFLLDFWLKHQRTTRNDLNNTGNDSSKHSVKSKMYTKLHPFLPRDDVPLLSLQTQISKASTLEPVYVGVTIVGFFKYAIGIGEDARTLYDVIRQLGIPVSIVDIGNDSINKVENSDYIESISRAQPIFPIVIFCCPLFEMARVMTHWGYAKTHGRYVIGYWPWELESLPSGWDSIFEFVDEVWASSSFTARCMQRLSCLPVHIIPLVVSVGFRQDLSPEKLASCIFQVLAVADLNSTASRKNPLGAIEAFKRAFPVESGVKLVLKLSHVEHWPSVHSEILRARGGDTRIEIVDENLNRVDILKLIRCSDVYLSLHRSEGFGRVLAEAMLLGTPVICIGWSGPSDFVDDTTAFIVEYELRDVQIEEYPYACGQWAEPNLESAAKQLRKVYESLPGNSRIVERAEQIIRKNYNPERVAVAVKNRIVDIIGSFCAKKI